MRAALLSLLTIVLGCKTSTDSTSTVPPQPNLPSRTFRMGFSAFPPKPSNESALATIGEWSRRADAAIMHNSVPYKAILSGTSAAT